jgi:hypothetical protein
MTAAGTGALASHVLLDAAGTARIPEGVDDEHPCCAGPVPCAVWPMRAGPRHSADRG